MKTPRIIAALIASIIVFALPLFGQGGFDTNSPNASQPIDSVAQRGSLPGALSSTPVLVALFSVTLLCLVWSGVMLKQQNVRHARNWGIAAVACVAVWGLAMLLIEMFS